MAFCFTDLLRRVFAALNSVFQTRMDQFSPSDTIGQSTLAGPSLTAEEHLRLLKELSDEAIRSVRDQFNLAQSGTVNKLASIRKGERHS